VRFALVHLGNEESYGLLYAGSEFMKHGDIHFFDGEMTDCIPDIIKYNPTYLCFSPMTTFYPQAKRIEEMVKRHIDSVSVYGGHHATNCGKNLGDLTIVGAVKDIDLNKRGIVFNGQTKPEHLKSPARKEYFRDIPRMKERYRKVILSVTGCPFTCTYCSSSNEVTRKLYGQTTCHLKHRDIDDIIKEAKFIKADTQEIEWVDDDVLFGDQDWLMAFYTRWIKEIGLPMYVSTTSLSALKAKPKLLRLMRKVVNCVGLGVQAVNSDSLQLLGRGWDNKERIKSAYDRLTSFGFRVNMQCIVGLPIQDPVEDALDTIEAMRNIGPGSIISCYPLQIYPNTKMEEYVNRQGLRLNPVCEGDTNSGLPAIDFGENVNNRLKNICKLSTMVVKYNIDRRWLQSMLDINIDGSSQSLSMTRYYECVKDRIPDKADKIFPDIIGSMKLKY
jgi:radical SAM superfamily enzyme YgiQ (UPF0313 family)